MDFENGVIVKIYKSKVDPILVWGCLRQPQTDMGTSSGPMTLIFWQSPHFQNCDFERGKFFYSRVRLKSGQVCKKWSSRCADRSGKRWAIFIFSLGNDPKGGPLDNFFHILAAQNPTIMLVLCSFIIFSPLTRIIWPRNIDIFWYTNKLWPNHLLRHSYQYSAHTHRFFFVLLSLYLLLMLFFLLVLWYYIYFCLSSVQVLYKLG